LQAAVEQAQANADLGQVTNGGRRGSSLWGWSTLEQGDTDRLTAASRTAALAVAKANVTAQQAAVNRLQELTGFEQIKAPFDGVVTARNVNIGDLVNAGGTSGRALFQVADIHRMRIYVNVPQAFLGELKPGVKATLHLPGQQETFEAELSSTSNALEENSRTALVELQADNPTGSCGPAPSPRYSSTFPPTPTRCAFRPRR
jgi:membrane fusion protein (multidrug efflux system)